ncbi:MAG: hypothetical protein ACO3C1_02150 [Ilumatobacteraceae bacterium]
MKRSRLALLGTIGAAVAIPVVMSGAFTSSASSPSTPKPASPGVAVLAAASADDDPMVISSGPTTEPAGRPSTVHGNPHVVMFTVEWELSTGAAPTDLDAVLPTGWRDHFVLEALGRPGEGGETSATCTYAAGAEVISCEYMNAGGHEMAHGMNVPRSPSAMYSVTVDGVPTGWTVEADTVGEFGMRAECPKKSASLLASVNDKGPRGCLHTVTIVQNAPAATTTTLAPTTSAASSPPLPVTGGGAGTVALASLLLLAAGVCTQQLARRGGPRQQGAGDGH